MGWMFLPPRSLPKPVKTSKTRQAEENNEEMSSVVGTLFRPTARSVRVKLNRSSLHTHPEQWTRPRPDLTASTTAAQRWTSTSASRNVAQSGHSRLPELHRAATPFSVEAFVSHASEANAEPLLLPSLIKDQYPWRALTEWTHIDANGVETLSGMRNEHTANAIVDVEIGKKGRGYMDRGWQKIQMPFDSFLDAFVSRSIPSMSAATQNLVGYVAQQDLLRQIPSWAAQLQPPLPHIERIAQSQYWRRNYWIGPKDTFTPLHRDPYYNLFVQVIGSKRVHLFPPDVHQWLYISQDTVQKNTSTIPSEEYLLSGGEEGQEFPELKNAIQHPRSKNVVLHAGDALYIPKGWFHCVKSLQTSVSINDWWTLTK
ncbi:unnamed protein product [Sympodiomycopsis kandeliae]